MMRAAADRLEIDCLVEAEGWGGPEGALAAQARTAAMAAAAGAWREAGHAGDGPAGELTLVLSDDAAVQELNARWRGKDRPTNVLSFPGAEPEEIARSAAGGPPVLLGDVVLAVETCCREAEEQGKPLEHHVSHLVVHGVLHLFGHDHESEPAAERMEGLEREILAALGIPDPYDGAQLAEELCAEDAGQ
jgi:probable rRNA maturation factor